jgi:hypothetical protein
MKELINTESYFSILKNALDNKIPFANVRYSDGELMLLNRHQYYEEYQKAISKLIGYAHSEKENVELSNYLIRSLKECDVIGFPTERHLNRKDYFRDSINVFENKVGKSLLETKLLTSVDVYYNFLGDAKIAESQCIYLDYFEELLKDQDTVNYISCRNLDAELKAKYNIKNINSYIIAPESKFTSGYTGERHYPTQFHKIEEWIKTIPCEGNICLVGGGVISKIYNIWFKERGGISLDIGACFDLWAGKSTRGKGRGVDVIDETYKL